MRLVPYAIAVLLLAIRFRGLRTPRLAPALALLGLAFLTVRLTANTASLAMASNDLQGKLEAIDHIPQGARVAAFYELPCAPSRSSRREWSSPSSILVPGSSRSRTIMR